MSFSRAFQWYHSHLDPIWPDGTFNLYFQLIITFLRQRRQKRDSFILPVVCSLLPSHHMSFQFLVRLNSKVFLQKSISNEDMNMGGIGRGGSYLKCMRKRLSSGLHHIPWLQQITGIHLLTVISQNQQNNKTGKQKVNNFIYLLTCTVSVNKYCMLWTAPNKYTTLLVTFYTFK